jgi:hypothetical protein
MGIFPVAAADQQSGVKFRPGLGKPVGIVQRVQGEVVIAHDADFEGYPAVRGSRLFKGDTIQTLDTGRLRLRLNDGSIISLASKSKLKLTRSVYEKKKKRRSSFFSMALGKARFFVVKVLDFKRSEFKVKTPTAVCGVRGSDFILEATGTETIATALEDTELEFQSLAFLEEPPVILRDYEESVSGLNQRPTPPERLPMDRINEKRDQFIDVAPEKGIGSDDDVAGQEALPDDTGVDEVGELGDKMNLEDIRPSGYADDRDLNEYETNIQTWTPNEIDTIKETVTEEIIGSELPEFPETP